MIDSSHLASSSGLPWQQRALSGLRACHAASAAMLLTSALPCLAQSSFDVPSRWSNATTAAMVPVPTQMQALRVGLTPNTRLLYETRSMRAEAAVQAQQALNEPMPKATLGLEMKSTKPHAAVSSLLRVQLTSDSALKFRPRHGGLAVAYQLQF